MNTSSKAYTLKLKARVHARRLSPSRYILKSFGEKILENYTVEAIVLDTKNFGDANKVVTLFSKEFGKVEANAYGCRRSRSPLSGAMQMFNHITAEISRGVQVDTIREADILHFYDALTADLERLA